MEFVPFLPPSTNHGGILNLSPTATKTISSKSQREAASADIMSILRDACLSSSLSREEKISLLSEVTSQISGLKRQLNSPHLNSKCYTQQADDETPLNLTQEKREILGTKRLETTQCHGQDSTTPSLPSSPFNGSLVDSGKVSCLPAKAGGDLKPHFSVCSGLPRVSCGIPLLDVGASNPCELLFKMIQACQENASISTHCGDKPQQSPVSAPPSATSAGEVPIIPLGLTHVPLRDQTPPSTLPLPLLAIKSEDSKSEQQLFAQLGLDPALISSLQGGLKEMAVAPLTSASRLTTGDLFSPNKLFPIPSQSNGFPLMHQSPSLQSSQQVECEQRPSPRGGFGQSRKVSSS
ncbi:unnamed protein product [Mesocestoides corti]|uniref:Uncharacterized protein n=1 Tax=Mesocestoides corti TaxID=53468 RepID=A0A0R3U7R3_MESCO|nr:unnamed protein product [Mesocestoides corti]